MRNLTGFLKKALRLLIIVIFWSVSLVPAAFAAGEDINTTLDIEYKFENKLLVSTYTLTLDSNSSYPTVLNYYSYTLPFSNPKNISVYRDGGYVSTTTQAKDGQTLLMIDLNNVIVKAGSPITILIRFEIEDFVNIEADVTQKVIFPAKYISGINIRYVTIVYPTSLGVPQYSSESYDGLNISMGFTNILFNTPAANKIYLIIGKTVSYDFTITKKLENTDTTTARLFEIYVPRSQYNQVLVTKNVDPLPDFAYQDKDHNLVFAYNVEAASSKDIAISGNINIKDNKIDQSIDSQRISTLVNKTGYWEVADQKIINNVSFYLNKYKDISTQRALYNYVIDVMELDKSTDQVIRTGAANVLAKKGESSAEDYCDALIALYRLNGIPARMVQGYVVPTDTNSTLFFHSWVEYFDEQFGWQIADPALDELDGKDIFGKQFFDHLAIIVRETSPISPTVGGDDSSIKIELAKTNVDSFNQVEVSTRLGIVSNLVQQTSGDLIIKNTGNTIVFLNNIDSKYITSPLSVWQNQIILPNATIEVPIEVELPENPSRFTTALIFKNINEELFSQTLDISLQVNNYWWYIYLKYSIIWVILLTSFCVYYFVIRKTFTHFRKFKKRKIR